MAPRKVDTSDMEKARVDLRINIERHRRRFNDAQQRHTFEEIIRDCLSKNMEDQPANDQENFVLVKAVDLDGSRQLRKYLNYLANNCNEQQQFDMFNQTIRASLEDSMRAFIEKQQREQKGFFKPPVTFCLCCGRDYTFSPDADNCCPSQAITGGQNDHHHVLQNGHESFHEQDQEQREQQQQDINQNDYQMPPIADEPEVDIGDASDLLNRSAPLLRAELRAHMQAYEPEVDIHEQLNFHEVAPTASGSSEPDDRSSPELDPNHIQVFIPEAPVTPPLSAAPTPDLGLAGSAPLPSTPSSNGHSVSFSPRHHIVITSTPNGKGIKGRLSSKPVPRVVPLVVAPQASGSSSSPAGTIGPQRANGRQRYQQRKSRISQKTTVSKKEMFTQ